MEKKIGLSMMATYISRGCFVVPIQVELYDEIILQIQKDILEKVKETGVKGVIIDVSGVEIIDSFLAQAICDTAKMTYALGATTVLTGIKPEIAASLVDLDIDFKEIQTALNLDAGFQRLESRIRIKEELIEIEEVDDNQEDQVNEDEKSRSGG